MVARKRKRKQTAVVPMVPPPGFGPASGGGIYASGTWAPLPRNFYMQSSHRHAGRDFASLTQLPAVAPLSFLPLLASHLSHPEAIRVPVSVATVVAERNRLRPCAGGNILDGASFDTTPSVDRHAHPSTRRSMADQVFAPEAGSPVAGLSVDTGAAATRRSVTRFSLSFPTADT